jgi:hypothetical protein
MAVNLAEGSFNCSHHCLVNLATSSSGHCYDLPLQTSLEFAQFLNTTVVLVALLLFRYGRNRVFPEHNQSNISAAKVDNIEQFAIR